MLLVGIDSQFFAFDNLRMNVSNARGCGLLKNYRKEIKVKNNYLKNISNVELT